MWANRRQSSHHVRLFPPQVWLLKKNGSTQTEQVIWTVCTMIANFAICFLGWWRCFANNYLHWAAGTTWLLLIAQGNSSLSLSLSRPFSSIIFMSQSIRSWRMSFVWVWNLAEHRSRVFKNGAPRKIFGPKREEETGEWRELCNEKIHDLFCTSDISTGSVKWSSVGGTGRACSRCGEKINAWKVSMGKMQEGGRLEDLGISGGIILKWI